MAAGEDDFLAVGREIGAGRLADAGTDAANAAGFQILHEDLIKGIAAIFFLGLEDDGFAVGREVALAGADEVPGDLTDVFQMNGLVFLPVGRLGGEQGEQQPNVHAYAPFGASS